MCVADTHFFEMRLLRFACLLFVSPIVLLALNGFNEIPAFSEKRRELTSEFALLQKDLKACKTTSETNAVAKRLDDFCIRVNELRGDENPPESRSPFGILAECYKYRNEYGTTGKALSDKVKAHFFELKTLPLPTVGNYDPQAINKIQRVLDKMNELLISSERVRVSKR